MIVHGRTYFKAWLRQLFNRSVWFYEQTLPKRRDNNHNTMIISQLNILPKEFQPFYQIKKIKIYPILGICPP